MPEAREIPILFIGPMVRAIREKRKTQTRQIITKRNSTVGAYNWEDLRWDREPLYADGSYLHVPSQPEWAGDDEGIVDRVYSRLEAGDIISGRETWRIGDGMNPENDPSKPTYRADWHDVELVKWRPSSNMPKWACRLRLPVLDVRPERLKDISEEDALAEGVQYWTPTIDIDPVPRPRAAFRLLWDSMNAKRGFPWDSNPWVWRYEFGRLMG